MATTILPNGAAGHTPDRILNRSLYWAIAVVAIIFVVLAAYTAYHDRLYNSSSELNTTPPPAAAPTSP